LGAFFVSERKGKISSLYNETFLVLMMVASFDPKTLDVFLPYDLGDRPETLYSPELVGIFDRHGIQTNFVFNFLIPFQNEMLHVGYPIDLRA